MEPSIQDGISTHAKPRIRYALASYSEALADLERLVDRYHILARWRYPVPRAAAAQPDNLSDEFPEELAEKLLSDVLMKRDALADILVAMPIMNNMELVTIADLDQRLREVGQQLLECQWIPLHTWRALQPAKISDRWWWKLDRIRFGTMHWRRINTRNVIWTLLALGTLLIGLHTVVQTANTLASFFLSIFVRVNAEQFGLDIITVLTVVAQILFSGRLSVVYSDQVTTAINQTAKRWRFFGISWLRQIMMLCLPVTRFFVGVSMFLVITAFVARVALPTLADQIRLSIHDVDQPLDSSRSAIESAALLDPDVDYPVDLTRLGIRYEEVGDIQQARQLYEEALGSEPFMVVTAYRLAELYIDLGPEDIVYQNATIRVLDRALVALDNDELVAKDLRLAHEEQRSQIEVLILITRGKVFFNRGQMQGALFDLHEALRIAQDHPSLFVVPNTGTSLSTTTSTDEAEVIPIRIPELYYMLAKTYEAQFKATNSAELRNQAAVYWNNVLQLADPRLGHERLWIIEAQPSNRQ